MNELAEHLGAAELRWLVDRLVDRLRQGKPLDRGSVTLRDARPEQRRAIDDLLGRRGTRGRQLTVNLAGLCRHLHLDGAQLRATVTALRGPIDNLRDAREADAAAWRDLYGRWQHRLVAHPEALHWLEGLRCTGLLKRLAGGAAPQADLLMDQAWRILSGVPHDGILLASLAARVSGDSHALDRGRPVATLCLRAIAECHGIDGSAGAALRRDAWAAIEVTVDDLSAPVLCLNLGADPGSDLAPWIAWHVDRGEPFYLTWRLVRRYQPLMGIADVHVCENPSLISEAAHRLGPEAQPIVCLNGLPGTPATELLHRLVDHDVTLHVRADFDWTGLRIVDQVYDPRHARLWRMTADDYRSCRSTQPLTGAPCAPPWAEELSAAMQTRGLAAYEEELADALVDDLR